MPNKARSKRGNPDEERRPQLARPRSLLYSYLFFLSGENNHFKLTTFPSTPVSCVNNNSVVEHNVVGVKPTQALYATGINSYRAVRVLFSLGDSEVPEERPDGRVQPIQRCRSTANDTLPLQHEKKRGSVVQRCVP